MRLKEKRRERIFQRAGHFCDRCGKHRATHIILVKDHPSQPLRYLDRLEAVCELCAKKPHVEEVVWKNAGQTSGSER